jgi:hypothetical protein
MEYEKIYNDAYLKEYLEVENSIKSFLSTEDNLNSYFNEHYNYISKNYQSEFKEDKFNKTEPFVSFYVAFVREKNRRINNKINIAFTTKVLPLFNEKKELIDCTFEDLIKEIARFEAKIEVYQLFANNQNLFNLIHKSKDYSKFEIKEYDKILEQTDIYIYYDKILHPDRYIIGYRNEKKNNKVLEKSISNFEFETDEQALILNLCLVDRNSIPITEKVRLLILIGKISDDSILIDSSSDNDFYQKVNKGILKKGSTQNKIILLNNILLKLEGQKLEITIQTIKKHKLTLQNEQNNTKKE